MPLASEYVWKDKLVTECHLPLYERPDSKILMLKIVCELWPIPA